MMERLNRACLGFCAGAIAALVFHQGLAEVFDLLGIGSMRAFRTTPTWPLGLPAIVSLTFGGGLYGAFFAVVSTRLTCSHRLAALVYGFILGILALFVFLPLRGIPMLHDGAIWPICRTLILNVSWGLGLSLILPWLQPRPLFRPRLGTKSA